MTTFSELQDLADDESQPVETRRIAEVLAEAINDWPVYNLHALSEYVRILRIEVGGALTQANIHARLKSLSFDEENDIWRCSSLGTVLYAWDSSDEDVVLDELVKRIGLDI